jgi:phage-related protein
VTDKELIWVGSSRADLSALPEDARRQLGFELREVQRGRAPRDWKPMPTVGAGVVEIRVRDAEGAFRLFYVAKFGEAIYVLHAFQKNTQKTSALDLELARSRYAAVRRHRQEK